MRSKARHKAWVISICTAAAVVMCCILVSGRLLRWQGGKQPGLGPRVLHAAALDEARVRLAIEDARIRYYVHGTQQSADSVTAPARDARERGVSTAAPVFGPGRADPEALRAKGRLLVLNASICAANKPELSAEIDRQLGPRSPVAVEGALPEYVADACAVAPPQSAAYVMGDVASCYARPVFAKARPCGCTTSVLLDLTHARHFGFDADALDAADIDWESKQPVAFWRGAATGAMHGRAPAARYHLLTRWALSQDSRVNVGMTELPMTTGNATRDALLRACAKPSVIMTWMLRYRYLVSAEGYDVATNLKWALWSSSAVIMPRPTVCSWLMEDRLVPWVHYIPVAHDFSNLTDAVDWCEDQRNAGVCKGIGQAGRAYMEQNEFLNASFNQAIGRAVAVAAVRERRDLVSWN